jgi:hypothetical protein
VTAGQVAIITAVAAGRAGELREYLSTQLPRDPPPTRAGPGEPAVSPFTGVLPPTHFARFVVIEMHDEPYLFFSSRFDGPTGDYLRALAHTDEALTIWSHCQIPRAGAALTIAELEAHLCDRRHWSPTPYVVSAIPPAVTVARINRALSLRAELARFVSRAPRLDPAALAHEFRQLPAIRALLGR